MKNIEFDAARKLVTKFIEKPNFPKEIKIAYKLLCKSPDVDAWEELVLTNKVNTLSYFLTKEGSVFIPLSQHNPYLLDLDKLCPKTKNKIDLVTKT